MLGRRLHRAGKHWMPEPGALNTRPPEPESVHTHARFRPAKTGTKPCHTPGNWHHNVRGYGTLKQSDDKMVSDTNYRVQGAIQIK